MWKIYCGANDALNYKDFEVFVDYLSSFAASYSDILLLCHIDFKDNLFIFLFYLTQMKRKEIGINKVYDARALRVIVGDKNGALHSQAVQCCYNLLNIVHRCIN